MENSPFYIKKSSKSFEETLNSVKQYALQFGFKVVAEHNMKNTFECNNLPWDKHYTILSICNPHKSHHALSIDYKLGCFMPKNIIVFEDDLGQVNIMLMKGDPNKMNELFPGKNIGELSATVMKELTEIVDKSV